MSAPYADYVKSEDKQFIKDTLNEVRSPFEIGIFGSENYFNLGSILRTGHSFLVNKYHVICCPAFYAKAAMTARPYEEERMIHYTSIDGFVESCRDRNIISVEKDEELESVDIRAFQYPENPIIVLGSEKYGIPKEILKASKSVVSIPMLGLVHSFNVACAASIVCYDWYHKHTCPKQFKKE